MLSRGGVLDVNKMLDEQFTFLAVKHLSKEQRIEVLEVVAKEVKPDVLILDGIVDFSGFMDSSESENTINLLMRIVHNYNTHIINVLHFEPKSLFL